MPCRAVVEHVFGAQTNDMGGTLVRTIGLARAKAKIGMKNLALSYVFSGFHAKREPLPGTLYMPVSGGGWIVNRLVFEDRVVV